MKKELTKKDKTKKEKGAEQKSERESASAILSTLEGVDVNKMTNKQLREFVGVMGIQAGFLDETSKVKPLE
jgi:hypothetical protein